MKFFNKKSEEEKEEAFEKRLIQENQEELQKTISDDNIQISVIQYYIDESVTPSVIRSFTLIDNFLGPILPEKGAIIWIEEEGGLRPFSVIRYDFFATENIEQSVRVYVVVKPASSGDILNIEVSE